MEKEGRLGCLLCRIEEDTEDGDSGYRGCMQEGLCGDRRLLGEGRGVLR